MVTVLLVIHLMVVLALVAVVLLQRSEGGALGIGGGGGFFSSRGTANLLTRTTGILAAVFFATSLVLGILASMSGGPGSLLDRELGSGAPALPDTTRGSGQGILDTLRGASQPAVPPAGQEPAPPAAPAAPAGPQVPSN